MDENVVEIASTSSTSTQEASRNHRRRHSPLSSITRSLLMQRLVNIPDHKPELESLMHNLKQGEFCQLHFDSDMDAGYIVSR